MVRLGPGGPAASGSHVTAGSAAAATWTRIIVLQNVDPAKSVAGQARDHAAIRVMDVPGGAKDQVGHGYELAIPSIPVNHGFRLMQNA